MQKICVLENDAALTCMPTTAFAPAVIDRCQFVFPVAVRPLQESVPLQVTSISFGLFHLTLLASCTVVSIVNPLQLDTPSQSIRTSALSCGTVTCMSGHAPSPQAIAQDLPPSSHARVTPLHTPGAPHTTAQAAVHCKVSPLQDPSAQSTAPEMSFAVLREGRRRRRRRGKRERGG